MPTVNMPATAITNRRLPYKQFRQYGKTTPKVARQPEAIREYGKVADRDLVVRACFDVIVKAIVSSTDKIVHQDPEIADFCNYALRYYEDLNSTSWQTLLEAPLQTLLRSGFSVSEVMLDKNEKREMVLSDLITYDPNTILLYPDRNGRLVESKSSYYNPYTPSGFYQLMVGMDSTYGGLRSEPLEQAYGVPYGMIRLPRKKIVYLAQHNLHGNHYGISSIAPLYRWILLKEAFIDMMGTALDRYGNPVFYIALPDLPTGLTETDDEGIARAVTTFETLKSQLANLGSQGNALLLPYAERGLEPKVGQIVQPQNIGSVFIDAIEYCNQQIAVEMGVPGFIIATKTFETSSPAIPEHQMASFWATIEDYRAKILNALCRQVFAKIIEYNFDNRPSARHAPNFSRVYSNRAEDRVATMQVVQGLAKTGALNPQEQIDFDIMRQMAGLPSRSLTKTDADLFNRLYSKGKGGRPTGTPRPQQVARPKVRSKPNGSVDAAE